MLGAVLLLAGCATPGAGGPPPPGDKLTATTLMRVADQTRDAGDLTMAAGLYERAHDMDAHDPRPLLALGDVWARLHRPKAAIEAWQGALAIDPANATALRGLANAEIETGKPGEAIRHLQAALAVRPDWRLQNSLGVAYDMLGEHGKAQSAYRAGLVLAPGNLQLADNLGLSLALGGDFAQALPMLAKAARDPAAGARQRQNLALAYGLAGDDGKAAQILKRDLKPQEVQANLGYYEYLRLLHDRKAVAAAIGAHRIQSAD